MRPYPVSCPLCRAEGSPNAKLRFEEGVEFCRYHPRQELVRTPPKEEKPNDGR